MKVGRVPLISAILQGLVLTWKAAECQTWSDNSLNPIQGGSKKQGSDAPPNTSTPCATITDTIDINAGRDAIMNTNKPPTDGNGGLAATQQQFNNPLAQLRALFPYIIDAVLSTALTQGGSIKAAVSLLQQSYQFSPTPLFQASGSGMPAQSALAPPPHPTSHGPGYFDNLADFLFEKLS